MPVHNDLAVDAEVVTALQALIVIQHPFINLFTQRGTCDAASCPSKKSPENGSCDTAHSDPYGPTDNA